MRGRAGVCAMACLAVAAVTLTAGPFVTRAQAAPLIWSMTTRGASFDEDPYLDGIAQGVDGTIVLVGVVRDAKGRPTAAAWRSRDGTTWERAIWQAPRVSGAAGVAAVPSGFVAVGGSRRWTSPDGTSWTAHTVPDAELNDVEATGERLVVAGQLGPGGGQPTLWGATGFGAWRPVTLGTTGRAVRVAVSPEGTVVVAGDTALPRTGATTPILWLVKDGLVTSVQLPGLGAAPGGIMDLRWTPVGFVLAVLQNDGGQQATSLWVSQDGRAWRRMLDLDDGSITAIGAIGIDAVAFGTDRIWRSTDGREWLEEDVPAFQGTGIAAALALADGRLLAAGARYTGPDTSRPATFLGQVAAQDAPSATTLEPSPWQ